MSLTRWVQEPAPASSLTSSVPPLENLEVVYLTDPEALAEVLPPPLSAPPRPRVHVRFTDIDLRFGDYRHKELVGYFAVDALLDGEPGEYPLLIPIDLEHAIAISRERYGEPKKLADITLTRSDDGDVHGSITRDGVTFIEVNGHETRRILGLTAAPLYRFDLGALAPHVERIGPTVSDIHGAAVKTAGTQTTGTGA